MNFITSQTISVLVLRIVENFKALNRERNHRGHVSGTQYTRVVKKWKKKEGGGDCKKLDSRIKPAVRLRYK
jgi:hypothetical protein